MMKKARKGFSLVEASIVLGLVGMVIAALWSVMSSVRETSQAAVLQQETLTAVENIRAYFANRALPSSAGDVTSYSESVLRAAKVYPEDTCNDNCASNASATAKNVYNGTMSYALPTTAGIPDANMFTITQADITRRACIENAMKLSGMSSSLGLVSVKINTNAVITTFPVSLTKANTDCDSASSNTLLLKFMIRM